MEGLPELTLRARIENRRCRTSTLIVHVAPRTRVLGVDLRF